MPYLRSSAVARLLSPSARRGHGGRVAGEPQGGSACPGSRRSVVATRGALRARASRAKRAPKRRELLARLAQREAAPPTTSPDQAGAVAGIAENAGPSRSAPALRPWRSSRGPARSCSRPLKRASSSIRPSLGRFAAHLLYGVTGSGKTEVYLQIITAALGPTARCWFWCRDRAHPQLVERFQHVSARVWWRAFRSDGSPARDACAQRTQVCTHRHRHALGGVHPARALEPHRVDEEHDASTSSRRDSLSARDLAVLRAQRAQVPVILGSATPSLETLDNVAQGRYLRHECRKGRAPRIRPPCTWWICANIERSGVSQPAMSAIERHLKSGGQVIVFLNRGAMRRPCFAMPAAGSLLRPLRCAHDLHAQARELRCHHCGARTQYRGVPDLQPAAPSRGSGYGASGGDVGATVPRCASGAARSRHGGRERRHAGRARSVHQARRASWSARKCSPRVITFRTEPGGHLDADQGLFASDFGDRAAGTDHHAVAGRAGRAARPGEVIVQTSFPDTAAHPFARGRLHRFARPRSRSAGRRGWPRTRGSRCCGGSERSGWAGRLPAAAARVPGRCTTAPCGAGPPPP